MNIQQTMEQAYKPIRSRSTSAYVTSGNLGGYRVVVFTRGKGRKARAVAMRAQHLLLAMAAGVMLAQVLQAVLGQ